MQQVIDVACRLGLCVQAGHSVLIFCGSKAHCEKVAKHIAKHITVPERAKPATAAGGNAATDDEAAAGTGDIPRAQLPTELTRVAAKPDEALKQVLPAGVAYHHSGLTMDERQLVERAFCSGAVWLGLIAKQTPVLPAARRA